MQVKFKKIHDAAILPSYAKPGDAGLDIMCVNREFTDDDKIIYHTGLAVEIPEGYVGLLFPRSSICKKQLSLSNSVGVIDSGYRGEIKAVFNRIKANVYDDSFYSYYDRIIQMIILPIPHIEPIFVDKLSDSERGTGGYGSTGN